MFAWKGLCRSCAAEAALKSMSGVCGTILTSYQRCGLLKRLHGKRVNTRRLCAIMRMATRKRSKRYINPLLDIVAVKTHPIGWFYTTWQEYQQWQIAMGCYVCDSTGISEPQGPYCLYAFEGSWHVHGKPFTYPNVIVGTVSARMLPNGRRWRASLQLTLGLFLLIGWHEPCYEVPLWFCMLWSSEAVCNFNDMNKVLHGRLHPTKTSGKFWTSPYMLQKRQCEICLLENTCSLELFMGPEQDDMKTGSRRKSMRSWNNGI